ncbi:MAG: hypothetical protein ACM3ZE_10770 [Myxococcales bacterium]
MIVNPDQLSVWDTCGLGNAEPPVTTVRLGCLGLTEGPITTTYERHEALPGDAEAECAR